jgi:pSer/pThr/pTyr-binding forkhead associated (FHA) protein
MAPPAGRRPGPSSAPKGRPAPKSENRPKPKKRPGAASSRRSPQAVGDILCWLCCDPLPPIPLGPKPTVTIGRSDKCDLVLPHKEVSRVHALIKVRLSAGMIVIEDEGSSNGTFVNGKRAPSSILREGDEITLGPYEVVIRSHQEMNRRDDDEGESTNSLELTSVARILPSAAMTGLLQEVPMTEVLQGIEFNKKSGTLSVTSPDRVTGVMAYSEGRPLYAGYGELRDAEAVLAMIALKAGSFALTGEVEAGEHRMQTTMTGLLLEASRRIDEGEDAVRSSAKSENDEEEEISFGFADVPDEPDELSEDAPPDTRTDLYADETEISMDPVKPEDISSDDPEGPAEPAEPEVATEDGTPEGAQEGASALEGQDTVGRLFDSLEAGD